MTDLASIGPVSITDAQLWDNNQFSISSGSNKVIASGTTIFTKGQFEQTESFSIICSQDDALQLKGLVEIGEPVWINTSTDITDNDYLQHKGWYILKSIDFELVNLSLVQCNIDCELISTHLSEYLTLDYSTGAYDGLALDYTFEPTTTTYDLQDDMSTADNWQAVQEYELGGGNPTTSGASDGAEIDIACAASADANKAIAWMRSDEKYYPPFTLETILDYNALPAGGAYNASIAFGMSKEILQTSEQAIYKNGAIEWFYYQWLLNSASTYHELATSRSGNWIQMYPWTSVGVASTEMGLKIELELDGTMTVYTDYDTTGTYTQIYKGPINIQNLHEGLYMYLVVGNEDATSFTGSFQKLDIYNADETNPDYVVCLPYNSTVVTTATGNRTGEDGNIPYYTSPTTELRYQIAAADMYKGSVKLLSTNNTGADSLQVYSTDYRLTAATTILKNAFTKLEFDADEMVVFGYHGGQWNEIMDFDFGTSISIMKPLLISPDEVWLQINNTKIHMTRSSPMISLYHPNTAPTYTLRDRYYHNGALTNGPAADADIAMTDADDGYYAAIYDTAADTYQLVIGKKDSATIKSDSLPADDITGIGWWEKNMTGINTKDALVRQWWKQTRTRVSWKQIV